MDIIEVIKLIVIGIIEGITEWLPVSSTGHMYLFDEFFPLAVTEDFKEMFFVVIQLGAILSVLVFFWNRLFPFGLKKEQKERDGELREVTSVYAKTDILTIWLKVIIACIPAAILGFLFDDILDEYLYNGIIITVTLILYGIAFIVIEIWNKKRVPRINTVDEIDYKTAIFFGLFQCLALIPGTSRSGVTILGALLIGVARTPAAEFSFFLAIPIMVGASLLKIVKFLVGGGVFGSMEIASLVIGMAVAFVVSLLVIKFLMDFVKKHDFKIFGWYRIGLGVVVLVVFILQFTSVLQ